MFRPERIPPAALAGIDAVTVGYLTEALASDELRPIDQWRFDRLMAAGPGVAAGAELAGLSVWRLLTLPVADRFYRPVPSPTVHLRVLHVHAGLDAKQLARQLDEFDVAFSREHEDRPAFEQLLLTCVAGGLLVVSEPLDPSTGLEPDIDFVSIDGGRADETLDALLIEPGAFQRHRIGGRMKAERWRASSSWSRLVLDLGRDLAAFGRRG